MKIHQVPIGKLIHPDYNPRQISEADFEQLKRSLAKFEAVEPAVVNMKKGRENVIVGGNQRIRAAGALGWSDFPCVFVELTAKMERELNVRLNKNTGSFDFDILANQFDMDDLLDWGFRPDEFGVSVEEEDDGSGDDAPEPPKEAKTVLGELWTLGEHRLLCGDATNPQHLEKLMAGETAVLCVTDPPYGVEYDPEWRKEAGINKNKGRMGKVSNDDVVDWGATFALLGTQILYVWHAGRRASEVQAGIEAAEYDIVAQIIWAKDRFALSRGDYHWQHEPCWYAVKNGKTHNWQGARDQATLWEIPRKDDEDQGHSTQKPVECMARPIQNNTAAGDTVVDPFGGSGTTIIACEKLNRKCRMMEIDPIYCDVILTRWAEFTGNDPVREDGKKWSEING